MATHDKRPLNSHDDPVMVDNGPLRLDLRGKTKAAEQVPSAGAAFTREFTFFSQLLIATIKNDDLQGPPAIVRLGRTTDIVFTLKHGAATATVTMRWKKGQPDEPYENTLIVEPSGIDLEDDGEGRFKAKSTHKDFRIVKIAQGTNTLWERQGDRMFFSVLIPETEL